jgi:hypothetical protein
VRPRSCDSQGAKPGWARLVRMLSEIYSFLADHRSTVSGKADKFAFRFAELEDRVSFAPPVASRPDAMLDRTTLK